MTYTTYRGLPPLAGLASMEEAQRSQWSVEESVTRLKRLHYMLRRLHQIFTARLTAEPIYELKTAFSYHAYLCSEQVGAIRQRVSEMRQPPLGLEVVPDQALKRFFDEILAAPETTELVAALYGKALPALLADCDALIRDAHPLADAPTARIARLAKFELADVEAFGRQAIECLVDAEQREEMSEWLATLDDCLRFANLDPAERSDAELPAPHYSAKPYEYDRTPRRDERFKDPYNAGVNPEAFLYDERFSDRDKTLMMFYKRLRELDVPEMMASILHEMPDQPWEFHGEMTRQLWDEARHAMMGEVGFAHLNIDWREVPINFTWSLNLNTQLTPQERHGVLFFIEQGLMPKTGKRYEWEVALASNDPLSGLFQDFDWADEVLHSQIGRRWYVPQFGSLNEALEYGDRCWSKVLSHWRDYKEQGLTEHRNWWPELYRAACQRWGVTPDPAALAYDVTYEDKRADLKSLSP
ncbi:hypothetical protein [Candidatus Laterigemmans baculatus]|uniref:hypothetical protein n=1 Tax=Candidatus Laterigemmans baculatus TaxID=2770505 RepID=UPI0013DBEF67|nr:hypothetical protein [Candidatus Laterigemmans baculatus]